MPRFDANCSMLFAKVPFLDRVERAVKAAFAAVEFLFPHTRSPAAEIKDRLGYSGHSGCEYQSLGTTKAGLGGSREAMKTPRP
jgi:hydroxypyruvate isomerase